MKREEAGVSVTGFRYTAHFTTKEIYWTRKLADELFNQTEE